MSTVHADVEQPGRLLVFTKGAPDILLSRCHSVWVGDEPQPLSEERRARIREINEQLAGEALRTLGIAARTLPRDALEHPDAVSDQLEQQLVFPGLVGMIDPPREEVKDAIVAAKGAGIRKMVCEVPKGAAAVARALRPASGRASVWPDSLCRADAGAKQGGNPPTDQPGNPLVVAALDR
jgi:Ca2+-transporting ATPase